DELVERRRELLLARPLEPRAQDRHDLRLRPPVDEDDEAEAELLLVGAVELVELRRLVGSLLDGGSRRQRLRADRRVRVEDLLLLRVGQARCRLGSAAERILDLREPLDEACAALEQLRELLDAQLPR